MVYVDGSVNRGVAVWVFGAQRFHLNYAARRSLQAAEDNNVAELVAVFERGLTRAMATPG